MLGVALTGIQHPLAAVFVEACERYGLRKVRDYCAGDIDGAFFDLVTQRGRQGSSAARACLQPALERPNLTVIAGASIGRVIPEDRRAVGVEYREGGATKRIVARREVIVSASTLQSPAILMRSGIGPAAALREVGVPVADHMRDERGS